MTRSLKRRYATGATAATTELHTSRAAGESFSMQGFNLNRVHEYNYLSQFGKGPIFGLFYQINFYMDEF
jgi:hypothetical protein